MRVHSLIKDSLTAAHDNNILQTHTHTPQTDLNLNALFGGDHLFSCEQTLAQVVKSANTQKADGKNGSVITEPRFFLWNPSADVSGLCLWHHGGQEVVFE